MIDEEKPWFRMKRLDAGLSTRFELELSSLYSRFHLLAEAESLSKYLIQQFINVHDVTGVANCELRRGYSKVTSLGSPGLWSVIPMQGWNNSNVPAGLYELSGPRPILSSTLPQYR
jgi:hypothetical protein